MNDKRDSLGIHAQWDGCELDLVATEAGLRDLANGLRNAVNAAYDLEERAASPGCTAILQLQVRIGDGKVLMEVDGQTANISGSRDCLSMLADNLDFLGSQWSVGGKQHLHLDPSSNALLLSQQSEAFVIGAAK